MHVSQNEKFAAHLGAFSSENSINEQTVDFTGFADFSAEKKLSTGHVDNTVDIVD